MGKPSASQRRRPLSLPVCILLLVGMVQGARAQVDHLPIVHPATDLLVRLHHLGDLPDFPAEHLPITRRAGLEWLSFAHDSLDLSPSMRSQVEWYRRELESDNVGGRRAVVIPLDDDDEQIFDHLPFERPFTGVAYVDSVTASRVMLDPVLDGEVRIARGEVEGGTAIVQGGVRLRGTIHSLVGFSATATNGTILGDEDVALDDPRYRQSFKFGQVSQNRDIDFGRGHARVDLRGAALEVGREDLRLGRGGRSTLLFGADLPSPTDYLRFTFRLGPFSYSHLHASLLAEGASIPAGPFADIPTKYLAAHLLSLGSLGPIRLSVGEAVIYGGRPLEIGYLNPFNFMKAQEHYLRDRDNSFLYATMQVWPMRGVMLEGELMLDDLVFSNIGTDYWGNKSAWRVKASLIGLPAETTDLSLQYTRLEPYVYTHFSNDNSYLHDGTILAAGGLQPNSHEFRAEGTWWPIPALTVRAAFAFGEHGANVVADSGLVRNVGGDVATGFSRETSSESVTFLDGTLEEIIGIDLTVDYEVMRNVYLKLRAFARSVEGEEVASVERNQVWFGVRIGAI